MPSTARCPTWVAKLVESSRSDGDPPSAGRTRRAWPFLVSILVGLALLYSVPRVTLLAAIAVLGVASGVVFVQRRLRRRHAASIALSTWRASDPGGGEQASSG